MNIAIITQNVNFENYISGGRWYPFYMGYALGYHGHNVKIITDTQPTFVNEFTDFPNSGNVTVIYDKHFCSKNVKELKDIDLFIGSPITGADLAVTYAQMFGSKSMVICYEPINWIQQSGIEVSSLKLSWDDYIKRSRQCDIFMCNARLPAMHAGDWIPEIKDKIRYIYNGINSIAADKVIKANTAAKEQAVCYIGRFDDHKGTDDLVNVVAASAHRPKLYVVTGYISEQDEAKLISGFKEHGTELEILKSCSDEIKFKTIAKCRCVFIPSHFEGFGIPPAEALYMGVPAIVRKLGIFKEVYGEHVLYYDGTNFDDLYAASECTDTTEGNIAISEFAKFENYASTLDSMISNVSKIDRKESVSLKAKLVTDKFVSVVIPVYNTVPRYFEQCIESLTTQTHESVEYVFVNDGSTNKETVSILERLKNEPKCRVVDMEQNSGIALAINKGISEATGEIIALVDSDDIINIRAIEEIAFAFESTDADIVYTNESHMNANGKVVHERKKPDFSLELLMQCQYINHLTAYRKEILETVGYADPNFKGSWDYDLLLRCAEIDGIKIHHIPKPLYNWRIYEDSFGRQHSGLLAQTYGMQAVSEHIRRNSLNCKPTPLCDAGIYISHNPITIDLRVKIFIPFVDFGMFLQAFAFVERSTTYPYKVVAIYHEKDGKHEKKIIDELARLGVECSIASGTFNFSKFNNDAVEQFGKNTDYVVLLNDDVYVGPNWLEEMLGIFSYKWNDVGAVGAKLLYPRTNCLHELIFPTSWTQNVGTIQHAGVHLLSDYGATHAYRDKPSNHLASTYVREYDSVTFGMVCIDSECFMSVKLNEDYPSDYNDMEFCIRARKKGWRIVYNPNAVGYHAETVTRRKLKLDNNVGDQKAFKQQYADVLANKLSLRQIRSYESLGL